MLGEASLGAWTRVIGINRDRRTLANIEDKHTINKARGEVFLLQGAIESSSVEAPRLKMLAVDGFHLLVHFLRANPLKVGGQPRAIVR